MRANNFFGEPNDERYTYYKNGFFNNQTSVLKQNVILIIFQQTHIAYLSFL